MIVVIATIAIAWALLTVLIVGICRAARRGDQVRRPETTAPSASRPDPHTARNRCWRLPADSAFGRLPRTAHRPGVDRV
jgi:hypothetical protein